MAFCLRGKSLPPLALSSLIPPFGKDDLRSCLTQSEASLLCRAHVVLCVCAQGCARASFMARESVSEHVHTLVHARVSLHLGVVRCVRTYALKTRAKRSLRM